jgi:flagellin
MISINSNVSADRMSNMLSNLTKNITQTSERIASGKRIMSAADDPAGMAIVSRLKYDNSSYAVASKNINQGF